MKPSCDLLYNARRLMRGITALSVLAALASPAAAQPTIQPGEVLTYFFAADDDPTTEHGIKDRSGNGHNGTDISFGTEFALLPGHNPSTGTMAAVMWGDDGGAGTGIYTHTKSGDLGIGTGSYTVMVWCLRGSLKGQAAQSLLGSNNAGSGPWFDFGFQSGTNIHFRQWGLNGGADSDYNSGGAEVAPLMTWHHVAFRYNSGTSDIFLDGALVNTAGNQSPPDHSQEILEIGRLGSIQAFSGLIEYPRVFNMALTDDQIAMAAKDKF
jgi:hypothetical protein